MSMLNDYYKRYYQEHGDMSYRMEIAKDTSRVRYIKKYLEEHLSPGDKVLDVGCGDGYLSTIMPQFDWQGIDINTEMAKCNAVTHDLMKTPYPFDTGSFDAVVCSEVLEHLWDLRVVQREVSRLLRSGGLYLVSTPNFDWIYYQMSNYRDLLFDPRMSHHFEHIRQYNLEVHLRHLQEAGFEPFHYIGCDAHFNPMFSGLRKYVSDWINEEFGQQYGFTTNEFEVDMVLGKSFPRTSHTIMILSRKRSR